MVRVAVAVTREAIRSAWNPGFYCKVVSRGTTWITCEWVNGREGREMEPLGE